MTVVFRKARNGDVIRTKELDVLPSQGDLIAYMAARYYIDERVYDLEKNEYNIYLYEV